MCLSNFWQAYLCYLLFIRETGWGTLILHAPPMLFLLTTHINGHLYETTKYQYLYTAVKVAFQSCIYHCPWLDWFSYHWKSFIVIGRLIVSHTTMWRNLTNKDRTRKLSLLSLAETQGSLVFSFNMLCHWFIGGYYYNAYGYQIIKFKNFYN